MVYTKEQIVKDIKEYIGRSGASTWSEAYVGVSKNAKDRLFNGHGVQEKGDRWIYRQAESSDIARETEAYFTDTLGTDGATGGGDETADYVYAYKKASHTDP